MQLPNEAISWLIAHSGVAALGGARAAGLAWTVPGLATPGLDTRTRFVFALMLGMLLVPIVATGQVPAVHAGGAAALGAACLGEVLVGAVLGWSASLIVAGARQAGELVAAQSGLATAAVFDPEAGDDLSALGQLYGLIALGVFLVLDGPLAVVRALVESYHVAPAGAAWGLLSGSSPLALTTVDDMTSSVFGRVGAALALSLRAAAPVAVAVALAAVALGLLGRAAPSLQLLTLTAPLRLALGLVLTLLGLALLVSTLAAAWSAWPG